eukprot:15365660-Ditylum_brightwellii.AAC.1
MLPAIGNTYLNVPCWEKSWTQAGPEFGTEDGTIFIVEDSSGIPRRYLCAVTCVYTDIQGAEYWAIASDYNVKVVIDDVQRELKRDGQHLKDKASRPYNSKY